MFKLLICASLLATAYGFALKPVPKFQGKIINGEDTTIEEFPYQVSFRYENEHNCGGSILDKLTVLTAAHCTDGFKLEKMSVRAGSTKEGAGGQLIEVAKVIQHENFSPYTYDSDVSLLKLKSPLVFGPGVAPIELQETGKEVPVGISAVITGWGDTVDGGEIYPSVLQKVNVNIISDEKCIADYGTEADVTKNMICAQSPGKDSCQGDSGGPLVADGKQIGIVSWGIGCANPKYPGVYTKVSALHLWILQHK